MWAWMIRDLVVEIDEKDSYGGIMAGFARPKASSYRETIELVIGLRIL